MTMNKQWIQHLILIHMILIQGMIWAGTTGKITGVVTEKESGNPLFGANIFVEGTGLGAAADDNGFYTILYIPPGTYTLKITMMGYTPINMTDVRVNIDQTTRINFNLEPEIIQGQEISVVAERNVIKQDVATSVVSVTDQEVAMMPISNVSDVVELQAGVEDGLTIRGGAADESLFMLNGLTLRDPRNNKPISRVALSAVKEISIERGGFNAEYGQVRSGIINVITKEGSKSEYEGRISFKYSPPGKKHLGASPFDPTSMWCRPFLDPEVCWEGTDVWDEYTQRQYPQFDGWNAISANLLADEDLSNDLSPAAAQRVWMWEYRRRPATDQIDYNIDGGFGGPVPFIGKTLGDLSFYTSYRSEREMLLIPLSRDDYFDYDWTMHLNSNINESMKLKIMGITGRSYNVAANANDYFLYGNSWGLSGRDYWDPTDFVRTPLMTAKISNEQRPGRIFGNGYYPTSTVNHYSFSTKLTHFLNPKTFYEASIEHVNRKYRTGPVAKRDTTPRYEIVPGYFVDEAPFGWSSIPTTGITGMFFGGHTATARDSSRISSTSIKFDITSQVNFNNLVKAGIEIAYYNLHLDYGQVKPYFGELNWVKMNEFPFWGAFYIQDKLETKGFIMNLGLRLDCSNANTDWIVLDAFDESYFSSKYSGDESYPSEKAKWDIALSPRLGISHPVTENSKLYFNYGHFKQLPTYQETFRIGRDAVNAMRNFGDPNLKQAKTVSYELGYDHVLFQDYLIQVAGYYRDILDQQAYTTYFSAKGDIIYDKANNNSYEDIRGVELTLRKSAGKWWTGFANYTYQVNTSGYFGRSYLFQDVSEQRIYDQNTTVLYQQKPVPQPYARLSVTFFTPDDFGPKPMGINLLGDWAVNIIGDWRAGEWITWNQNNIRNIINNIQVRDFHNIDLRMSKRFSTKHMQLTFFVEIENLFNAKYLSGAGFYDVHDQRYYFESLHLPKSQAYNNIVGDDRPGNYRKTGVPYQPIEQIGNIDEILLENIEENVIYYDIGLDQYMNYIDGNWTKVEKSRMDKILEDKAYIDMPNQTSFNFLNPRRFFFGITAAFNI